jgi:micrococcal nuclease
VTVRARLSPSAAIIVVLALAGCVTAPVAAPPAEVTPAAVPARLGIPDDAQRVTVRWVSDGDTVTVRAVRRGVLPKGEDTSVRLLEIDTPETKRPGEPVQCLARRATRMTERLLPRGSVAWVQRDEELLDRYGRTLGYVWNADGLFVNEALVRRGLARVLFYRPNDRHLERIRAAEDAARAAGRGVWSHC